MNNTEARLELLNQLSDEPVSVTDAISVLLEKAEIDVTPLMSKRLRSALRIRRLMASSGNLATTFSCSNPRVNQLIDLYGTEFIEECWRQGEVIELTAPSPAVCLQETFYWEFSRARWDGWNTKHNAARGIQWVDEQIDEKWENSAQTLHASRQCSKKN